MNPQGPADTINYMIAGYSVIFGVIFVYLTSLILRWRNLRQDEQMLNELEDKDN